ncbi:hypothetical protein [Salinibaculum rarum]|uniref:hypothetical protein n=1 Tax=Salinibaculum rarum TaxID=3058903 RepID=UPI00265DA36C|nr:hypothetical protein [Salinibaculum sp. KK48]
MADEPALFTMIEYDWTYNKGSQLPHNDGLAIPVINDDDDRQLVCQLKANARGLNNGWIRLMPIHGVETDVFVDTEDPRNSNPPINVDDL